MQTSITQPYAQLRQHLADRHAVGSSQPQYTSSLREFLLAVHERLLPELTTLASILEEAGIHCEVLQNEEDEDPMVGLHVKAVRAVLRLSPASSSYFRAVVAGGPQPHDAIEWFIPFHLIRKGGLERELQAAMLRLLNRCHANQ